MRACCSKTMAALGNPIKDPEERWKFYKRRRCKNTVYVGLHWLYVVTRIQHYVEVLGNENRAQDYPQYYNESSLIEEIDSTINLQIGIYSAYLGLTVINLILMNCIDSYVRVFSISQSLILWSGAIWP